MVERDIEESLDLPCVQVHSHYPVAARSTEKISHQSGRDGLARQRLLVLTRVREVRDDRIDSGSTGPLQGIDHDVSCSMIISLTGVPCAWIT